MLTRRARWFAPMYPMLAERLLFHARRHGHYPSLCSTWPQREPGLRELFACRVCGAKGWIEAKAPMGCGHVHGPMIEHDCTKKERNDAQV